MLDAHIALKGQCLFVTCSRGMFSNSLKFKNNLKAAVLTMPKCHYILNVYANWMPIFLLICGLIISHACLNAIVGLDVVKETSARSLNMFYDRKGEHGF